jgi:outer membrane protein assembly factor BamB
MRVRKTASSLLVIIAAALLNAKCDAQCRIAYTYTVCPQFGTLYVVNTPRYPSVVAAFGLQTGELKWSTTLPRTRDVQSDLAPTADVVAFAVRSTQGSARSEEAIEALDARTGKLAWVNAAPNSWLASAGANIFTGSKKPDNMIVIDGKDGRILWKLPSHAQGYVDLFGSNGSVLLTDLYAMDVHSGQILKEWPSEWDVSSGAFAGARVVIGTDSVKSGPTRLAAYSLPNFQMEWVREDARKRDFAALASDGDYLVVAIYPDRDSERLAGNMEVQVLKSSTGKLLWSKLIRSESLDIEPPPPVGLASGVAVVSTLDEGRSSSTLQGFDAATGLEKWTLHLQTVYEGVTCEDAYCYVAGVGGKVLSVNVRTGAQRWYRILNRYLY